ncbi:MAG: hypothetical protein A3J51_02640 [Omnitrophica WOR_2 bacterium RIFCSPHIGHO2_02_FULL_45_21]|nr:MAG: hypothetical protein A3J51_02640 [Omnitrophica WOR_2 bacterium RIFCSPHIGHO2_02_FULL_45_21]
MADNHHLLSVLINAAAAEGTIWENGAPPRLKPGVPCLAEYLSGQTHPPSHRRGGFGRESINSLSLIWSRLIITLNSPDLKEDFNNTQATYTSLAKNLLKAANRNR